jgi:hypothetical protein
MQITFFHITQKEIKVHALRPTDRLKYPKTIPGTCKWYMEPPLSSCPLKCHSLGHNSCHLIKKDIGTSVSVMGLTDVAV